MHFEKDVILAVLYLLVKCLNLFLLKLLNVLNYILFFLLYNADSDILKVKFFY